MTLVFVSMFIVIFVALTGVVSRTYQESVHQAQDETAFGIAEAGLNYGRWRLAHDIDNYDAATKGIDDPFGGALGSFDITFQAPLPGATTVVIESTGYVTGSQDRAVTLRARYGRPSLARFAAIFNGDVWKAGTVQGPIHANGGIRMDATSDSLVTSAKETYACQPDHGCATPFETKPGVWGTGQIQELWEFPVAAVDYSSITLDLLRVKTAAQASSTYYGSSGAHGYQLVFNADNTYSIYTVTSKAPKVWSSWEGSYKNLSHDVGTITLIETQPVPSDGVIYTEDTLWLKGDVRDRVTVAAGRFPDTPASNIDIILNGNISYDGVKDGSRVLGAIAQRHILIPWSGAPDVFLLDGAYLAQKGSFHRRYYPNCCGTEAHYLKTSLNQFGMIASNGPPTTAWVDGAGNVTSGYQSGSNEYDANLRYGPPPYFPASDEYEFISWEEVQ